MGLQRQLHDDGEEVVGGDFAGDEVDFVAAVAVCGQIAVFAAVVAVDGGRCVFWGDAVDVAVGGDEAAAVPEGPRTARLKFSEIKTCDIKL